MDFEKAKELLNGCDRSELRDHAFGDREIFWSKEGFEDEIAGGYFGAKDCSVWIYDPKDNQEMRELGMVDFMFQGDEARELAKCGKLVAIERNDEQSDDIPDYRGA